MDSAVATCRTKGSGACTYPNGNWSVADVQGDGDMHGSEASNIFLKQDLLENV
jgi:hypothetical protein